MRLISRVQDSYKIQRMFKAASVLTWSAVAPLRRLWLPFALRRRAQVDIHFGCGEIVDSRFINVDARAMAHVDLVTKSPMLTPLPAALADSIYACHVFEHLSFHAQGTVLQRWWNILKPGGTLRLSVPDFDKLVDRFLAAGRDPLSIQASLMGAQNYPGNFHFAILTRDHLTRLLQQAGFVEITGWHPSQLNAWPRDHSWTDAVSLNLVATKPLPGQDRVAPPAL